MALGENSLEKHVQTAFLRDKIISYQRERHIIVIVIVKISAIDKQYAMTSTSDMHQKVNLQI